MVEATGLRPRAPFAAPRRSRARPTRTRCAWLAPRIYQRDRVGARASRCQAAPATDVRPGVRDRGCGGRSRHRALMSRRRVLC